MIALQNEIKIYDPSLCERPALVVGNKIDVKNSGKLLRELRKASELPVIGVSAKNGDNISALAMNLRSMLIDEEKERKKFLLERIEIENIENKTVTSEYVYN